MHLMLFLYFLITISFLEKIHEMISEGLVADYLKLGEIGMKEKTKKFMKIN